MWRDTTRLALLAVLLLALVLTVIISVRGSNQPPPSPTVDIAQVQTQAVRAFAGGLTSTALALPTSTETHTPERTEPTQATAEAAASESPVSPTPSCYRLKFLQDLTVPDNSLMTPAEVFTKSWQVQNNGTCAWRPGFRMVLVGGVAMGGSPFTLDTTVNPGSKIEISIKMVAPTNQTGIVQGTWRMTDANGNQFGDALTVVIVVTNGTAASTAAPTSTP
jgi:hypothetical protein